VFSEVIVYLLASFAGFNVIPAAAASALVIQVQMIMLLYNIVLQLQPQIQQVLAFLRYRLPFLIAAIILACLGVVGRKNPHREEFLLDEEKEEVLPTFRCKHCDIESNSQMVVVSRCNEHKVTCPRFFYLRVDFVPTVPKRAAAPTAARRNKKGETWEEEKIRLVEETKRWADAAALGITPLITLKGFEKKYSKAETQRPFSLRAFEDIQVGDNSTFSLNQLQTPSALQSSAGLEKKNTLVGGRGTLSRNQIKIGSSTTRRSAAVHKLSSPAGGYIRQGPTGLRRKKNPTRIGRQVSLDSVATDANDDFRIIIRSTSKDEDVNMPSYKKRVGRSLDSVLSKPIPEIDTIRGLPT